MHAIQKAVVSAAVVARSLHVVFDESTLGVSCRYPQTDLQHPPEFVHGLRGEN